MQEIKDAGCVLLSNALACSGALRACKYLITCPCLTIMPGHLHPLRQMTEMDHDWNES